MIIQGAIAGWLLFGVIWLSAFLIDNNLWYGNYQEFGRYSSERPVGFGSGFYMAYKNWKRTHSKKG